MEDGKGDVAAQKDDLTRSFLRVGSGYSWLRIVYIDTP